MSESEARDTWYVGEKKLSQCMWNDGHLPFSVEGTWVSTLHM